MKSVIAALLGVIAAGVMVITVELLPTRTIPWGADPGLQGISMAPAVNDAGTARSGQAPYAYFSDGVARPVPVSYDPYEAPRLVRPAYQPIAAPAPRRARTTRVETPGRDWTRTALVIGGSSAAGAGIGALIGGKKGALIGAALGGGAGTLYEVKKR